MVRAARRVPLNLGQVVATPAALDAVSAANDSVLGYLVRHCSGDWGDVDAEDGKANDDATWDGGRVLSVYKLKSGETIWIITEADRSVTTVLLPSDY